MTTMEAVPFANARIRVKRDVLFTETEEGVLFHNAHGGFQLKGRATYRFASLIVPFLNGETSVKELCEHLSPHQHPMVSDLVRMLLERGLARDVVPQESAEAVGLEPAVAQAFSSQVDYIDHYEDRAAKRFLKFRQSRVVVLGDDAVAAWCALSLIRNGAATVTVAGPKEVFAQVEQEAAALLTQDVPVQVEQLPARRGVFSWSDLEGFDLVVSAGTRSPAQTLRLLANGGVPVGQRLLPVTMYGERVVVGPLSAAGSAACWSCAMLRLGFNSDSAAAADVWRAAALGTDHLSQGPGHALSAIVGNLLGYEAFKEFTGVLPTETQGAVIIQDVNSFDTVLSKVLPHPLCPSCAAGDRSPASGPDHRQPALLRPAVSQIPDPEAPEEADQAVAELDRLAGAFVSSVAGVFKGFDDEWPTQLPLKVSRLEFGVGTGAKHTVNAFDLHHVAAARMSAMYAAAAEYIDRVTPPPALHQEADTDLPKIATERLGTFSGLTASGSHRGWIKTVSLLDGTEALLPAAAVRPYSPLNAAKQFTRTGAGLGVGTSPSDALYRAVFSALAYQGLQRAMRSAEGVALVSLADVADVADDSELVFLLSSAENLGRRVEVLRLPTAGTASVMLARTRLDDGTPLWAVGADACSGRAVKTALCDLLGQCQLVAQRADSLEGTRSLLDSLDPYTVVASGTVAAALHEAGDADAVLDSVRSAGYQLYALIDGCADLREGGLHAARVLIAADGRS